MRSYRLDGNYLRDKASQAYVACFQEGATAADRAAIKAAPRLLEVLKIIRSEGAAGRTEWSLLLVEEVIKEATP